MELNKGLNKDANVGKLVDGSWSNARNIVMSERRRDVTNEKGFDRFKQIDGITIGYIVTHNTVVVFTDDNGTGDISIIDENLNYTTILRSADLRFKIEHPIEGVFTYNNKQELVVAWWDGLADDANPPKVLNLDCLPFAVDGNSEPLDPAKLKLLQIFPDIGCAEFVLDKVYHTGGVLVSGVYAAVYAYVLEDGTVTNWTGISNWIPIIQDFDSKRFTEYEGCESDSPTSKSIELTVNNIDTNFDKIRFGIIKKIGGIISAVSLQDHDITSSSISFTYNGLDTETDEDVVSMLTPTTTFKRVKTGTILENRLHLSNTKQQEILDYQAYANNIKVTWVREDSVKLLESKGSYKDPLYLFDKKGYAMDSVYAPVIIFKLLDGTFSRAFHIPNVAPRELAGYPGFFANSLVSAINAAHPETRFDEALIVDSEARFHEFFNDALATGEMGYWENQDEVYPDRDCSDIKNAAGAVIGNIRNQKVRHHKFPSNAQLHNWGNDFFVPSSGAETLLIGSANGNGWTTSSDWAMDFGGISTNVTYLTAGSGTDGITFTAVQDMTINLNLRASIEDVTFPLDFLIVYNSLGGVIQLENDHQDTGANIFNPQGGFGGSYWHTVDMVAGESIQFKISIPQGTIITRHPLFGYAECRVYVNNTSESDATSKILGFKLEDIHIPTEIADVVDCYYIGYAKRTINNLTKIGHSKPGTIDRIGSGVGTGNVLAFANFDTKYLEPAVTVDYVKPELEYTLPGSTLNYVFATAITAILGEIRAATEYSYVPAEVVTTFAGERVDNTLGKHAMLVVALVNTLTSTPHLFALYQYKKNLYKGFREQKIVLISKPQTLATTTIEKNYGGDVVINIFGQYYYQQESIEVHENASVVGYRYADNLGELVNDIYPPNYPQREISGVTADQTPHEAAYLYNLDYSSLNDIITIFPAVCYGDCDPLEPISSFPFRVARSPKQGSESNIINWRKFFINDYYEMRDKDKGEVWKIQSFNRTLIIYQKYAMFVARPKDLLKTDSITAALGEGDIFDRTPDELAPDGKGYAGNQSQWAVFMCKHGVIHIDAQQGKVFIFNGALEEISNKNMYRFFEDLKDVVEKEDNPFNGSGWVAGYDESYNRLIITKHDGADTVTISYSFDYKVWVCNHDYAPNVILYTRNFLLSFVNDSVRNKVSMYKHNISDKYAIYYEDSVQDEVFPIYESFIEPVFAQPSEIAKVWKSINWQTIMESEIDQEFLYDETFTHILIYNNNQCTGIITLEREKNLNILSDNSRNSEYTWRFKDFRDIVRDRDKRIIDKKGIINVSNLNNSAVWFHKSKFISKFIAIRLIYDNVGQRMLHLQHINVLATKSKR